MGEDKIPNNYTCVIKFCFVLKNCYLMAKIRSVLYFKISQFL